MSIRVELNGDLEERVAAAAAARGQPVDEYVRTVKDEAT